MDVNSSGGIAATGRAVTRLPRSGALEGGAARCTDGGARNGARRRHGSPAPGRQDLLVSALLTWVEVERSHSNWSLQSSLPPDPCASPSTISTHVLVIAALQHDRDMFRLALKKPPTGQLNPARAPCSYGASGRAAGADKCRVVVCNGTHCENSGVVRSHRVRLLRVGSSLIWSTLATRTLTRLVGRGTCARGAVTSASVLVTACTAIHDVNLRLPARNRPGGSASNTPLASARCVEQCQGPWTTGQRYGASKRAGSLPEAASRAASRASMLHRWTVVLPRVPVRTDIL